MSTLNSRLQLSILNRKKAKDESQKGFTLVELMIVVVVVGVLSAVALPNFLGVKSKATLSAEIGEKVGLAKECSSAILMGGPYPTNCRGAANLVSSAPTAPVIYTTVNTADEKNALTVGCGPTVKLDDTKACKVTVNDTTGSISFDAV